MEGFLIDYSVDEPLGSNTEKPVTSSYSTEEPLDYSTECSTEEPAAYSTEPLDSNTEEPHDYNTEKDGTEGPLDYGNEEPLHSELSRKYSSLMDRINASRKLEEECYEAVGVCNASTLLSRLHCSSLSTTQELIEENKNLLAENMSLKFQLTNASGDISTVLRQRPDATFQELRIESLENQLKAARLSMVGHPASCIY